LWFVDDFEKMKAEMERDFQQSMNKTHSDTHTHLVFGFCFSNECPRANKRKQQNVAYAL